MSYKCLKNNNKQKLQPMFDNYEIDNNYHPVNYDDKPTDSEPKRSFLLNLFHKKANKNVDKNVEHFICFLGIGDCSSSSKVDNLTKNTSKLNKKINNSTLETSVNNMVNAAMTNALQNNKASISAMAQADNDLDISNNDVGDGGISGINQNAKSTVTVDDIVKQENIASISNDFSTQISSIIDKATSDVTDISNKTKDGTNIGQTIAGIAGDVAGVANNAITTAGECFKGLFGGGSHTQTSNTIINEVNEEINIDNSVTSKSENNIKNIMETLLSAENIANAISTARASNKLVLSGNKTKFIKDIHQEAIAENITKALVNQVNNLKVGNKVLNKLDKVLHQVNNKYYKSEDTKSQGDLADIGTGLVGIIAAGGDAGKKILDGAGNFVKSPFEGLAELMWPLIGLGVLVVIGLIVWLVLKKSSKSDSGSSDDFSDGDGDGDLDSLGDS
jgi:hypothetical protein